MEQHSQNNSGDQQMSSDKWTVKFIKDVGLNA
jgi:hypothetical protein